MKRSKMVESIEMMIDMSRGQYNTHQLASRLLDTIESIGMLPPDISNDPYEYYLKWEREDGDD